MLMLKEMEYVYAVYEEQSFSKAARKLYLSQPALSAAVRRAEAEIHTPIFDRSTNPIRLTAAGEATALPLHREIIDHERRVWEALGEDTMDTLMAIQARYIRTFREVQA